MSQVQAVYFPSREWQLADAAEWVATNGLKPIKYSMEAGNHRFRIRVPDLFDHFITKLRMHDGKHLYLVIGFKLPRRR